MHCALLLPEMLQGICAALELSTHLPPHQDPSAAALRALMTVNRAFSAAAVRALWTDCTLGDLVRGMPPELWYKEAKIGLRGSSMQIAVRVPRFPVTTWTGAHAAAPASSGRARH
jgi:hypothetical protein